MGINDAQEYADWVRAHAPSLFRLAYRLSGKRDVAEDLLQETFTEAWKSRATLADPAKIRPWLFQILRYRWMHQIRDASRRLKPVMGEAGREAMAGHPARGEGPAKKLAEQDALQRALDTVEDDMKLPLLLVVMEGYTCQEVADMLAVPLGTVLSRIHRAKAALRAHLERAGEGAREGKAP